MSMTSVHLIRPARPDLTKTQPLGRSTGKSLKIRHPEVTDHHFLTPMLSVRPPTKAKNKLQSPKKPISEMRWALFLFQSIYKFKLCYLSNIRYKAMASKPKSLKVILKAALEKPLNTIIANKSKKAKNAAILSLILLSSHKPRINSAIECRCKKAGTLSPKF